LFGKNPYKSGSGKHARWRHGMKIENQVIIGIESRMPSKKTVAIETFILYMEYISNNYETIVSFYDRRFSKVKFWGYVGRQKALSEVT